MQILIFIIAPLLIVLLCAVEIALSCYVFHRHPSQKKDAKLLLIFSLSEAFVGITSVLACYFGEPLSRILIPNYHPFHEPLVFSPVVGVAFFLGGFLFQLFGGCAVSMLPSVISGILRERRQHLGAKNQQ